MRCAAHPRSSAMADDARRQMEESRMVTESTSLSDAMAEDDSGRTGESRMDTEPPPPSDAKAPMKFSFTVSKSSSSSRPPLVPRADRHRDGDADMVEYVSTFDGKGRDLTQAPVKIIPLPERSYRPEKRMKNIMVASENLPPVEDMFEVETLAAGPQPSVKYGLQLKKINLDSGETPPEVAVDRDLQRYRDDMAVLPDEMSVHDYDNVPVEEFGEALLRGMGWEKDKPIGRNSTTIAQPIVAVRRNGREGLGAIPAPQPDKVKKFIKPGESRKTKLAVGRIMCVIAGVHAGSRGQIAEVSGNYYTVSLLESGKRVRVREDELAEVGSPEEEKAVKKLADLHIDQDNNRRRRSFDDGRRKHHAEVEARRDGHSSPDAREVSDARKSDEGQKSSHRKGGRSRSVSREEADNGIDNRHKSRKDGRDKSYGYERGTRDGIDDSRHQKHESRTDNVNDEKEHYEAAPSRHGQQDRQDRSSRHEAREDKNTLDSNYRTISRAEMKGHSSDVYKEKNKSSRKENLGMIGGVHAEDTFGKSERRGESWLARDIRVRIIDKRAYGDTFYLQKACVVDVVSPLLCDIQMDAGGRIIEKVKQEHLETALPKRGGRVLVVGGGKYRGQIGTLEERDSAKGVGLVQLEDNYEVLTFDLDHLAEYVGVLHGVE